MRTAARIQRRLACHREKKSMAAVAAAISIIACASACAASPGATSTWPVKPVRVIVPFGAGGVADIVMRPIADKLAKYGGQPFVIDNRPGAGGNIGAGVIALASADGYQILFTPGSVLTMNPSMYAQVPFDSESFAPVSLIADMAILAVVPSKGPVKSVSELIAAATRDSGKLLYASPGVGTSLHLAGELFQRKAGVAMQHVAYKSGGEAVTATLATQANLMFANPALVVPHIKAGTLRALLVASTSRIPQLPEVPTAPEAGLTGFEMSSWFGLVSPAKTPRALVSHLSSQVDRALREPDVQQRFAETGVRTIGGSPDEFARFLKEDRTKWEGVIRSANIRLD